MKSGKWTHWICAVTFALSPTVSYGDAVTVQADQPTASQPNGGLSNFGGASSGSSIKDGSDDASSDNKSGQAMSMLTGAMLVASGVAMISAGKSHGNGGLIAMGVMTVGMGMMSFAQGGAHGGTASGAGLTSSLTDGYEDAYSSGGGIGEMSPEVQSSYNNAQNQLKELERQGIYNPKTGSLTANGKTYSASDFASKGAMAAAGFSQGAIDGAMSYAGKISKKAAEKITLGAMTAANGYQEGGGGGGSSGSSASAGSGYDSAAYGESSSGALGAYSGRDPSSLAGMQKNYNGEPIGVAADSIFLMMTRRYKVKESQESFYREGDFALQK